MIALYRDDLMVVVEQPVTVEQHREIEQQYHCWVEVNRLIFFDESDAILFFLRYSGRRTATALTWLNVVTIPAKLSVGVRVSGRASFWVESPNGAVIGCYEASGATGTCVFACQATEIGMHRLYCNREAQVLRADITAILQ